MRMSDVMSSDCTVGSILSTKLWTINNYERKNGGVRSAGMKSRYICFKCVILESVRLLVLWRLE